MADEKPTIGGRVVADPPTARLMAVVLQQDLVDAGADRAGNAELGDIRTESRPGHGVRTRFSNRAVCPASR
jgi:hypothetical protein